MNEFDSNLTKSLEDFMESYKMIDVEQIYSNGTEFVPIFRVKQWLEYNNINNLQSKIDKAIEYYETHQQECVIGRNKDDKLIKDYYLPAQCSKKLYEFLKEDK